MTEITKVYYQIKDNCRKGLLKNLERAFAYVPKTEELKILDIGCGTGVPTIWLSENYGGIITAIDTDGNALEYLHTKIIDKKFENQITTCNISFFDLKTEPHSFDIILAEGFLNIVGFKECFVGVIALLKEGGYFVIHDEYKDHEIKCDFIRENDFYLAGTLLLDESVWWNDYYKQLEEGIESLDVIQKKDLFKAELNEIELYKKDPSLFRSIYYVVIRQ